LSSESELRRQRDAANRIRADIGRASSTVAAKRKKAADAQASAARSTNASTIRMKSSEAERATKEANDAEKKRAELEKKLAEAEVKVTKAQEKYEKERSSAQTKALSDLRRSAQRSSARFAPRRLGDSLGERSLTDHRSAGATGNRTTTDVFLSHASEDKDYIARPPQGRPRGSRSDRVV